MAGRSFKRTRRAPAGAVGNATSNPSEPISGPADADIILDVDAGNDVIADDYSAGDDTPVYISPGDIDAGDSERGDSGTGKKRGRKPGSRNKSKKEASASIETMLFSVHAMLAAITKMPELQIDRAEAATLATAINEVNEFYDIAVISPKTMAWINLVMAMGGVYGPRIAIISMKRGKPMKAQVIDMNRGQHA